MASAAASLADISLLLLTDAAVPRYASAIVAALVALNQQMKSQMDTLQADVRSIKESIDDLKSMNRDHHRETDHNGQQQSHESSEEQADEPNKRDLAFSVYLREVKEEKPDEEAESRETHMDEEEEEEEDEYYDEDDDEQLPGPSAATAAQPAALAAALLAGRLQPPDLQQLQQPSPAAAAGGGKRIILPCPRRGCEVLLYSQLGFSAHLRIHDGKMPFECTNCGREFRLRDGLVKHMRTHTGERPYPCQVCGKHFKRIHHRKKHLQQHILNC